MAEPGTRFSMTRLPRIVRPRMTILSAQAHRAAGDLRTLERKRYFGMPTRATEDGEPGRLKRGNETLAIVKLAKAERHSITTVGVPGAKPGKTRKVRNRLR